MTTTPGNPMTRKDPSTWPTLKQWADTLNPPVGKKRSTEIAASLAKRGLSAKHEGRWRVKPGTKDPRKQNFVAGWWNSHEG